MTMPVQAVSVQQVMEQAGTRGSEMQSLSDKFSRMMSERPPQEAQMPSPGGDAGTPATHFVRAQEEAMRQTYDDVRAFTLQAPSMSVQEMSARQIELSYQLSMVQVQFNAGVYVAQSSKNGLQTLMKNQ